jgi:hypothetical protein
MMRERDRFHRSDFKRFFFNNKNMHELRNSRISRRVRHAAGIEGVMTVFQGAENGTI